MPPGEIYGWLKAREDLVAMINAATKTFKIRQ